MAAPLHNNSNQNPRSSIHRISSFYRPELLALPSGYEMSPSSAELFCNSLVAAGGLTIKKGLTSITWQNPVDLRTLRKPLSEVLSFTLDSVEVYRCAQATPVRGFELNKPCKASFALQDNMTRSQLRILCRQNGTKMVSFDKRQKQFIVQIPHFTRYDFSIEIPKKPAKSTNSNLPSLSNPETAKPQFATLPLQAMFNTVIKQPSSTALGDNSLQQLPQSAQLETRTEPAPIQRELTLQERRNSALSQISKLIKPWEPSKKSAVSNQWKRESIQQNSVVGYSAPAFSVRGGVFCINKNSSQLLEVSRTKNSMHCENLAMELLSAASINDVSCEVSPHVEKMIRLIGICQVSNLAQLKGWLESYLEGRSSHLDDVVLRSLASRKINSLCDYFLSNGQAFDAQIVASIQDSDYRQNLVVAEQTVHPCVSSVLSGQYGQKGCSWLHQAAMCIWYDCLKPCQLSSLVAFLSTSQTPTQYSLISRALSLFVGVKEPPIHLATKFDGLLLEWFIEFKLRVPKTNLSFTEAQFTGETRNKLEILARRVVAMGRKIGVSNEVCSKIKYLSYESLKLRCEVSRRYILEPSPRAGSLGGMPRNESKGTLSLKYNSDINDRILASPTMDENNLFNEVSNSGRNTLALSDLIKLLEMPMILCPPTATKQAEVIRDLQLWKETYQKQTQNDKTENTIQFLSALTNLGELCSLLSQDGFQSIIISRLHQVLHFYHQYKEHLSPVLVHLLRKRVQQLLEVRVIRAQLKAEMEEAGGGDVIRRAMEIGTGGEQKDYNRDSAKEIHGKDKQISSSLKQPAQQVSKEQQRNEKPVENVVNAGNKDSQSRKMKISEEKCQLRLQMRQQRFQDGNEESEDVQNGQIDRQPMETGQQGRPMLDESVQEPLSDDNSILDHSSYVSQLSTSDNEHFPQSSCSWLIFSLFGFSEQIMKKIEIISYGL